MDDQKIDVSFLSVGQNPRRNINRRADARNTAGIFDLQTIKRIVPIAHVANPQKAVCITDNLGKRRHGASVGAFVPNAEAKHRRLHKRLYTSTAKTITRPSIPRTSCGGSSSNTNKSAERSRTASVTSNGLPTVFVRPCMREAMLTVLPIAVNSSRCGEPTLPTIAGPE